MKFLQDILDAQRPLFEKGGKFERFYRVWEANETFLFTPAETTKPKGVQVRDAIDLKRMMFTVVVAMVPCLVFGIWNVGYQRALAMGVETSMLDNFITGAWYVLPVVLVSYAAGGLIEVVFSVWRNHPINEGYLVTGMLIALVMPPNIPLWQVALAAIFAVLIAKEVFGGTGMNVLNVAMTARAFLYFAYPVDISGEDVWTAQVPQMQTATSILAEPEGKDESEIKWANALPKLADGYTGATYLGMVAAANGEAAKSDPGFSDKDAGYRSQYADNYIAKQTENWAGGKQMFTFSNMAWGAIPGSIGETSTVMALIGALILIFTGVGSWKIIVSCFGGAYAMAALFYAVGWNAYMSIPPHMHLVAGGLAFGAVFMATDPVSAAHTEFGKWIYGALIGVLTVIIRVTNPAYPEGIMLAVLLMNVAAPLIDFYVIEANKKRRVNRGKLQAV